MNKHDFLQLVSHPEQANSLNASDLYDIQEQYPYFQAASLLLAKATKSQANIQQAALQTIDRAVLRAHLDPSFKLKPKSPTPIFAAKESQQSLNSPAQAAEAFESMELQTENINAFDKFKTEETQTEQYEITEVQEEQDEPENIEHQEVRQSLEDAVAESQTYAQAVIDNALEGEQVATPEAQSQQIATTEQEVAPAIPEESALEKARRYLADDDNSHTANHIPTPEKQEAEQPQSEAQPHGQPQEEESKAAQGSSFFDEIATDSSPKESATTAISNQEEPHTSGNKGSFFDEIPESNNDDYKIDNDARNTPQEQIAPKKVHQLYDEEPPLKSATPTTKHSESFFDEIAPEPYANEPEFEEPSFISEADSEPVADAFKKTESFFDSIDQDMQEEPQASSENTNKKPPQNFFDEF
ncbi:MAG: hypothetical protein JJT94_03355 [Bernardetiaceae bacterium]|nr:hypothetical protein [Bernardetiaceae bacterium]